MKLEVKSIVDNKKCLNELAKKKVIIDFNGEEKEYDYINKNDLYNHIVNVNGKHPITLKECYVGNLNEETLVEKDKIAFSSYEITYDMLPELYININSLEFEDVLFNGLVRIVETNVIGEMKFKNSIFNHGLYMKDNFFNNNIEIKKCYFGYGLTCIRGKVEGMLGVYDNIYNGSVSFIDNRVKEMTNVKNNTFNDEVEFWGVHFGRFSAFGKNEYKKKLIIRNNTFNEFFSLWKERFFENIKIYSCEFKNSFKLNRIKADKEISIFKNSFHREMELSECEFNDNVLITKNLCEDKIIVESSNFSNELAFYDMEFKNVIEFDKVNRIKALSMVDCFIRYRIHIDTTKIERLCMLGIVNDGIIHLKDFDFKSKRTINMCHKYEITYKELKKNKTMIEIGPEEKEYSDRIIKNEFVDIVAETILTMKKNAGKSGNYEEEDELYYAYKKEAIKPRETDQGIRRKIDYLFRMFFEQGIGGFGTKPIRVLVTMLLIILGFAIIYRINGIEQFINDGMVEEHIKFNVQKATTASSLQIEDYYVPIGDSNNHIKSPNLMALYFSAITFFTIGYGDVSAWNELIAICVIIEGFLGVFLMAYLSVAFARKLLR